jgi:uncharacterized zinc-type alcohol dehydrogenase-like protein
MCEKCDAGQPITHEADSSRRGFFKGAAALTAGAAALGAGASPVQAAPAFAAARTVKAWGVTQAGTPVRAVSLDRRPVGPKDVAIDILYCGVCHSDIHTVRGEWGPIPPLSVPGHEIVGRVVAVGSQVTRFRLGDMAGVGCMVDSCGTCENCKRGEEQYCLNGATWTYGAKADVPGGVTQGGWAKGIVVTEHFVIRMPQSGDLAAMAPLLCAGVTTFSPLRHWHAEQGMRVGVLGVGGLGHMAAKLAAARGADVTLFTSTPGKLADAKRLGATDAVLTSDATAMAAHAERYDLIISTVPESFPLAPYLPLLTLNGTLVSVGTPADLQKVAGGALWWRRRSVAASLIGSIAETQDVIDFCAARHIAADIELIRPDQINAAMDRVKGKDVRYRFVIDMTQV